MVKCEVMTVRSHTFWQRSCTAFMQKDCPDHREGVSFCRPIFRALPNLYRLGTEVFQIVKKTSVFGHSIAKQIPKQ